MRIRNPARKSAFVSFLSVFLNYVFVLVQLYVESTWDVLQLTRSGSTRENPFQRNASARGSSDKADTKLRLTKKCVLPNFCK